MVADKPVYFEPLPMDESFVNFPAPENTFSMQERLKFNNQDSVVRILKVIQIQKCFSSILSS